MPRFFRCEEANPLRLVPFTVNTNGGPNDEGVRSLISARALLQEGVLAYPERSPSEATGSLASPHSGPTQVSFLLKPDQTLKHISSAAQSTTGSIVYASPKEAKDGKLRLSQAQEAIKFSIRHGLTLRGWTLIGSAATLSTMWVRELNLAQGKNSLDGCKVEIQFTSASSEGCSYEFKVSLEPIKVTTRRWEPQRRAFDNEVFLLPCLTRGLVVDNPGSSEKDDEARPDVAEAITSHYRQAYGLDVHPPSSTPPSSTSTSTISQGSDGSTSSAAMKMAFVALRGGNAEDGFWQHGMVDEEFNDENTGAPSPSPPLRVPLTVLLTEEPTEKKMSKHEKERVLSIMKHALVDIGLPEGLLAAPLTAVVEKTTKGAPGDHDATPEAPLISAEMAAAAEASVKAGECGLWSRNCSALGKGAPLFTTGNGNALPEELPRHPQHNAETDEEFGGGGGGGGGGGSDGWGNPVPSEVAKLPPKSKQVVTTWVSLDRLSRRLAEGPSWGPPAPLTPAAISTPTTSSTTPKDLSKQAATEAETSKTTKKAAKKATKKKTKTAITVAPPCDEATSNMSQKPSFELQSKTPLEEPAASDKGAKNDSSSSKNKKPPVLAALSPNKPVAAQQKRKASKAQAAALASVPPEAPSPAKKPKKAPAEPAATVAPPASFPQSAAELSKLKVAELKALCVKMGVGPLKTKADLMAQLCSLIPA